MESSRRPALELIPLSCCSPTLERILSGRKLKRLNPSLSAEKPPTDTGRVQSKPKVRRSRRLSLRASALADEIKEDVSPADSDQSKLYQNLECRLTQTTKTYSLTPKHSEEENLNENQIDRKTRSDVSSYSDDVSPYRDISDCAFEKRPVTNFFCQYIHRYGYDYHQWIRRQELQFRPVAYLHLVQRGLKAVMRATLIDWLVEVCTEYKLQSGTLFLIVELLDRSLSTFPISKDNLQLLGCTCLLLASKYEEKNPPAVNALVHISDSSFSRVDVIAMENRVLCELNYRISCITPHHFTALFTAAAECEARQAYLSLYLLELAMLDYTLLTFLPSKKAASAVLLARMTMHRHRETWPTLANRVTGYSKHELSECVRRMRLLHEQAETSKLHAVRDKYCKSDRCSVALICCISESDLSFH